MAKEKKREKTDTKISPYFVNLEYNKDFKAPRCRNCGYLIPNFAETSKCPNCDENPYKHIRGEM